MTCWNQKSLGAAAIFTPARSRPCRGTRPAAFTLIETMLAVLLLALLAAGVALSFSKPLAAARAQDAADVLKAFDAAARQAAVASGRPVRVTFDLADGTLARTEGDNPTPAAKASLPPGYRVERVKIGGRSDDVGLVPVDVSPRGWSRSYAVRLAGPGLDRWFGFAGLSGLVTEASDEVDLPRAPRTPGYDAD